MVSCHVQPDKSRLVYTRYHLLHFIVIMVYCGIGDLSQCMRSSVDIVLRNEDYIGTDCRWDEAAEFKLSPVKLLPVKFGVHNNFTYFVFTICTNQGKLVVQSTVVLSDAAWYLKHSFQNIDLRDLLDQSVCSSYYWIHPELKGATHSARKESVCYRRASCF